MFAIFWGRSTSDGLVPQVILSWSIWVFTGVVIVLSDGLWNLHWKGGWIMAGFTGALIVSEAHAIVDGVLLVEAFMRRRNVYCDLVILGGINVNIHRVGFW